MKVLLWGATGLIGSACLPLLLQDPRVTQVVAPTRKPLKLTHPKLNNPVLNFDDIDSLKPQVDGADASICCLGTTLKQAGSREAFHKVDFDYCMAAARLAKSAGVKRWMQVSAIGASSKAFVYYSRVKGELEVALKALQFETLSIYRPSMLMGDREQERPIETLAIHVTRVINPLLCGPLKPYRGIESDQLSRALVNEALQAHPSGTPPSVNVYSYEKIITLAAS